MVLYVVSFSSCLLFSLFHATNENVLNTAYNCNNVVAVFGGGEKEDSGRATGATERNGKTVTREEQPLSGDRITDGESATDRRENTEVAAGEGGDRNKVGVSGVGGRVRCRWACQV